jgi:dTDP-4-dehydrorhamnose 3,5-epimerase-like enzyme
MSARIIRPSFVRQDERGTLRELLNSGTWGSLVQGEMVAGAVMGNHYHKETVIFFFLLSGRARVVTEHVQTGARDAFRLQALEGVLFPVYESHAVTFEEGGAYLLLRSQAFDPQQTDTFAHPVS